MTRASWIQLQPNPTSSTLLVGSAQQQPTLLECSELGIGLKRAYISIASTPKRGYRLTTAPAVSRLPKAASGSKPQQAPATAGAEALTSSFHFSCESDGVSLPQAVRSPQYTIS